MSEEFKSIKQRRTRIASIVRKELSTLIKDKMSLFILFIIPIIIITTIGTGKISLLQQQIPVWIIDYDDTVHSHQFIQTMKEGNLTITTNYDYKNMTREQFEDLAKKLLPTNKLAAYIVIHKGFEADLEKNRSTTLEIHVDAIDFVSMFSTEAFLQLSLVNYQLQNMVFERDIFYFPEMRPELNFFNLLQMGAPLIMSILIFDTINMVSSQSIVGDIPLKRLLTTPVFRSEIVFGKTIAYSIISVFQIIIALMMLQIFHVPMQGLYLELFIVLMLCSLAGITLGILLSAISKTRLQAAQMHLFVFMTMLIITYTVRNSFILPFMPMEQTQKIFSCIAYRGMSIMQLIHRVLYLVIDILIYLGITLIYLKRKKEFV
ncbi:MAG: ABC transporter permease [Promethearchaeota archaeon]